MANNIKLFISHTTKDQRDFDLAHKLADGLKTWGVDVWIAPESIPPGELWEPALIAGVLEQSTHFLVILSETSIQAPYVLKEIDLARSRFDRGDKIKIFPLRMGRLSNFEHADFLSKFQNISYETPFSAQLRAVAKALSLPPSVPPIFKTLIEDTTRYFTGREKIFSAIQQFLANQKKGFFTLIGDPGEGKTTVLAEYVRRTGCPAHFNIASAGIETTAQFFQSVKTQLGAHFDIYPTINPGETLSFAMQLVDLFEKAAEARPKDEPFVLVIDALDEVKQNESNNTVNVLELPQFLPEGVFLLLSRRRKKINFHTREFEKLFDLMDISTDNRQDIEDYLKKRLVEPVFEPWLQKRNWNLERAVNEIGNRSENNFMYLSYLLRAVEAGHLIDLNEQQLPKGLDGYYEYQWRRLGMNHRPLPELTLRVLYVLANLRTPVSIRLLSEIIEASTTEVRAVIENWREFLHDIPDENEKLYRLYHSSFQEFLRKKEDIQDIDSIGYRKLIAEYFTKRLFQ